MSDVGDNNFVRYIYGGEEGERIPHRATHIIVHELTTVVLTEAFYEHPSIVEIICHDKVEKIEERAFWCCPSLKRVIMSGVTIVERSAFYQCAALMDVECGKLEMIKDWAFYKCRSLRSINLPSAKVVEDYAFAHCEVLTNVKFGKKLERIEERTFGCCSSLERITIPLKDGLILTDNAFQGCVSLNYVDLVEEVVLHKTIAALHLEGWRNDMNEEVDTIRSQMLLNAYPGSKYDEGEKAQTIRGWISSVLGKINHYKTEHQRVLDEEVATTLELTLPADIVRNNVLPFLELPTYTLDFREEGSEQEEEEGWDLGEVLPRRRRGLRRRRNR